MQQAILLFLIVLIFCLLIIPFQTGDYLAGNGYMNKRNTNTLKSIACIMVFVCHITSPAYEMGKYVSILSNMGYYAVGIFFFISGYGLLHNYLNKDNYLEGFLKKKVATILIPFYIGTILCMIVQRLIYQIKYTKIDVIRILFGIDFANKQYWYIRCLIVLYIIFYLCARLIQDKKRATIIIFFVALIYNFYYQFQSGYWSPILPFHIGILLAYSEYNHRNWFCDKYMYFWRSVFTIFLISGLYFVIIRWHVNSSMFMEYFSGIISQCTFVLMIVKGLTKIKFLSKIAEKISIISYKIYLLHQAIIDVVRYMVSDKILQFVFSLILSVFVAMLWHMVIVTSRTNKKMISQ